MGRSSSSRASPAASQKELDRENLAAALRGPPETTNLEEAVGYGA